MIPLGSVIIFYPSVFDRQVEASGVIRATNQLGAFIDYAWESNRGVRRTKEFFGWDELTRVQVLGMGGLCE